uniref:STM1-like N-terminal domain-containing protein n=1 Tax=Ananas comosus var. bracteatus TaxID=296719 RepID=A0A6V7PDT3_ANACO|nr:unnamed protein product [Ananas comosus var. bracteatus]
MATANPFNILGDDDNDDPSQLIAAQQQEIASQQQKGAAKKPASAAKLPSKPLPPAQAAKGCQNGGHGGGYGHYRGRGGFRAGYDGRNQYWRNQYRRIEGKKETQQQHSTIGQKGQGMWCFNQIWSSACGALGVSEVSSLTSNLGWTQGGKG